MLKKNISKIGVTLRYKTLNFIIKYSNALSINVVLGMLSAALFFLDAVPFNFEKNSFLILLALIIWMIYTFDHLDDGNRTKGLSGIERYDFHYRNRKLLYILSALVSALILWIIYLNFDADFVQYGFFLIPVMALYFVFKFKDSLNGLLKILIISIIASGVTVSLFYGKELLTNFLSVERTLMVLLAAMNQLVLEHFEHPEGKNSANLKNPNLYFDTLKRVFIWVVVFVGISLFLNPQSFPYVITILLVAIFLRAIPSKQKNFKENRKYRYWADFSFILMWPTLKLILWVQEILQ